MKKTLKERALSIGKTLKEAAYWTIYYTVGFSSMNGLGNGLANERNGESFSEGFGEAYVNNFVPGLAINSIYPIAHKLMEKTNHYRLYANLFNLGVGAAFLALHTYLRYRKPTLSSASINSCWYGDDKQTSN